MYRNVSIKGPGLREPSAHLSRFALPQRVNDGATRFLLNGLRHQPTNIRSFVVTHTFVRRTTDALQPQTRRTLACSV